MHGKNSHLPEPPVPMEQQPKQPSPRGAQLCGGARRAGGRGPEGLGRVGADPDVGRRGGVGGGAGRAGDDRRHRGWQRGLWAESRRGPSGTEFRLRHMGQVSEEREVRAAASGLTEQLFVATRPCGLPGGRRMPSPPTQALAAVARLGGATARGPHTPAQLLP